MRNLLIAALVALAAETAWVPVAAGQTAVDAHVLFERGNEHLQRGLRARSDSARRRELQEALQFFHQSLQIARSRSVIFNVAFCYEQLGRLEDAWAYYTEYLAFPDLEESDRAEARERLDAIRPQVALVEVTSRPAGATIFVDRRDLSPRGVTPVTIATRPGDRRIIAELEGYEPADRAVAAVLGESRSTSFELQARPSTVRVISDPEGAEVRFDDETGAVAGVTPLEATLPAGPHRVYVSLEDRHGREVFDAPPGGEIAVTVELGAPTTPGVVDIAVDLPGARVNVDGEEVGVAPVRRLRLTPGRHRITVTGDDEHEGWSDVVEVGPGHRLHLDVHLGGVLPARRFGPWPAAAMAAAAAIAIAGGAIGGWALALHADFDDVREACERAPQSCGEDTVLRAEALELDRRIRPLSISADVLLGTAGALAITAFALMLLNREVEDASSVRVSAGPLPGGAMATVGFGIPALSSP